MLTQQQNTVDSAVFEPLIWFYLCTLWLFSGVTITFCNRSHNHIFSRPCQVCQVTRCKKATPSYTHTSSVFWIFICSFSNLQSHRYAFSSRMQRLAPITFLSSYLVENTYNGLTFLIFDMGESH